MTEPVLFQKSLLIALMTALQTVTAPIVAIASLFAASGYWHLSFVDFPGTLAVVITLTFLVLVRPPLDVSKELGLRHLRLGVAVMLRWVFLIGVLIAVGRATHSLNSYPKAAVLTWFLITPVPMLLAAVLVHGIMRRLLMAAAGNRNVIIAGYNPTSLDLARRLQDSSVLRLKVEGFFDDRAADRLDVAADVRLLGKLTDLGPYTKQHAIDVIFIALPMRHLKRVVDLLDDLRDTTASIYYVPDIFVFDLIQARSSELLGIPVVAMCETPFHGYRGVVKRVSDLTLTVGVLLLTSPVFLMVALAVRLSSPGPVIFRQRRYGLDGLEIIVYKFRTMSVTEDGDYVRQASKTDARITRVGAILRRTSLDELPQLFNVLQGRMSLVGPRPHAVAHNEIYRKLIKGYMVRHKVLPGITGLAQVSGCRGETATLEAMEARVRYDLDYLRHWSPMLDIKILFLTALKMFRDDQAY
jgi:putative colanic acid biosynthesis UDP-glucose lipid carrier transferase